MNPIVRKIIRYSVLYFLFFSCSIILLTGCATFYQQTYAVQQKISAGEFEEADKLLEGNNKWAENNHRVLYYLNRGMVFFMLGEHEKSNEFFNLADYYVEEYRKNIAIEALVLISNPMKRPYLPEDFETIMIHYYKALNFIALKDFEGALVETRRINIRLQEINDQYKNNQNKYAHDAFAHNLMGIIYQASGDYNNAFIAYRNALEVYENDYQNLFNLSAPKQLKKDLLFTAQKMGFTNEVKYYEERFGISPAEIEADHGDLLYIWMNGFGPVKSEWGLTLTNMGKDSGKIFFANDELGISFPLVIANQPTNQQASLSDISIIRVAFPKYIERMPYYNNAQLIFNGKKYPLEIAQDINQIAFQSLNDRMLREIGNNLLRLGTKQMMEHLARKENSNLGALVSIANTITEKADTRNWQSLPYSLSYTRISLPEGEQELTLDQHRQNGQTTKIPVQVSIKAGETVFKVYHQLASHH